MATSPTTVENLLQRIGLANAVTTKKMFGEYGLYCHGKLVGVVCDNRLYIKPTAEGRALVGECEEAAPYSGAKPSLVIEEDTWQESGFLAKLIKATADALPTPKPKKAR